MGRIWRRIWIYLGWGGRVSPTSHHYAFTKQPWFRPTTHTGCCMQCHMSLLTAQSSGLCVWLTIAAFVLHILAITFRSHKDENKTNMSKKATEWLVVINGFLSSPLVRIWHHLWDEQTAQAVRSDTNLQYKPALSIYSTCYYVTNYILKTATAVRKDALNPYQLFQLVSKVVHRPTRWP